MSSTLAFNITEGQIVRAGGGTPIVEEWVRPSDWLPLPVLADTDQRFVGLLAVYNHDSNFIALSATGNYTVDWGDGVIEDIASGVQAEHLYTYSAISSATESSRGYRQVLVTVTPQVGQNLTSLDLQRKYSSITTNYVAPWLDISLNAPSLTGLLISGLTFIPRLLERVNIGLTGAITSTSFMFRGCSRLQSVSLFNTSTATDFSSMFNGCTMLSSIPLFNTSTGTDFTNMFSTCRSIKNMPLIDTTNGTTFNGMFSNCSFLKSIPLLNTSNGLTFNQMFQGCTSLESVPLFDFSKSTNLSGLFSLCTYLKEVPLFNTSTATNMGQMLSNCSSLKSLPLFDTSANTDFSIMFSGCSSIVSVPLYNTTNGINFSNMFSSCSSLLTIPLLDTAKGTNFSSMFNGCISLQAAPPLNTGLGTGFSSMFSGCSSLSAGALSGTSKAAISYTGCKLSRQALVDIFTNLGTATGSTTAAKTITITNNWGTPQLTAADRLIATSKGWTIAG